MNGLSNFQFVIVVIKKKIIYIFRQLIYDSYHVLFNIFFLSSRVYI